jgi:uncharacterized protein YxeA
MKKFLNLLTLLLAISVVDYSFEDSNGDRTKEIVTIHYSNNQEDHLILDKDLIDTARMYEEIDKISSTRVNSK